MIPKPEWALTDAEAAEKYAKEYGRLAAALGTRTVEVSEGQSLAFAQAALADGSPAPIFVRGPVEAEKGEDGAWLLTQKSTMDAFALKMAASEDGMIRRELIKLGWTPPEVRP